MDTINIQASNSNHVVYAQEISNMMEKAAKARGTGRGKRSIAHLSKIIAEGKAIIALHNDTVAGFCYLELWQQGKYVAHSGLIINPTFRGKGLAKTILFKTFALTRKKYPKAKIFGILTSAPVMKIQNKLGYIPVTFSELPQDKGFWKGCQGCANYDILKRTKGKHCLCTGMVFDPAAKPRQKINKLPVYEAVVN